TPASFVDLENEYGVSAVLTLNRRLNEQISLSSFAGVIFTLAERNDIRSIQNLKGKTFAAVDETSFGGWAMAWREMKGNGFEPYESLRSIDFLGSHEAVVLAVLDGKVDAGTVRTGILERMADEGEINLQRLSVLPHVGRADSRDEFPLRHSTAEYEEWPLASLVHVNRALVRSVVAALLELKAVDEAALAAHISGWYPPTNYVAVHHLMKDLRWAQYQDYGEVGLFEAVRQHWHWGLVIASALIILMLFSVYVLRLNLQIRQTNIELKDEVGKKLLLQSELLAESEKVNKILDNMLEGVVAIDKKGVIQTFNQAAEKIFSYSSSEVLGEDIGRLMPQEDSQRYGQYLKNYVATQQSKIIGRGREVFGRRKNGDTFPLEISVSEVVANGEQMFIAVMRDLSEHKQTEQKIMRLVTAIQHAAEGVFIVGMDGCTEYVNPAYEAITGYSQDELNNQTLPLFKMAKQDEVEFSGFFDALKNNVSWSGQFAARHRNGHMYEEAVTIAPVLDDKGDVNCYVGVCRDVSEKLLHDQHLLQLEKFEMLAKMAGGFAHDFNNLLSTIVGYTEMALLEMDKDSEPAADLGRVLDSAARAKFLVQKMQALSRQDYDKALAFMPQKTVHEVVALLKSMVPAGARINARVLSDGCEIFLAPAQFQTIVMSLGLYLVDALGDEKGQIDISLSNEVLTQQQVANKEGLQAGEYVVLTVASDCRQMKPLRQADFFERTDTAHEGVATQPIGLAEVYGIVNHNKACLEVECFPGGGIGFSVYLPCAHQGEAGESSCLS
ncbi:MAG TPA: PAS domain S-box protein, partial [Candidatus Tenderia electrophaga]|nr:PAS domain S-box protein [Candidatus Tenderia electrophaga]